MKKQQLQAIKEQIPDALKSGNLSPRQAEIMGELIQEVERLRVLVGLAIDFPYTWTLKAIEKGLTAYERDMGGEL